VIVEEEHELAERLELVGERLRELRESPLEASPAVEVRGELLAELSGIAAQRPDEIAEEDERVLVAALQGQPRGPPARRAQKVRVLREESGLPEARGGVDECQAVPFRTLEPVEQPLPPEERKR
jgi:hypothetical protein